MALKWFGRKVTEKMRRAQVAGVNETLGASVVHAKQNHPWQNRTGALEGGIQIVEFAAPKEGGGVKGVWGVTDARQARILEEGGTIKAKSAKALHFVIGGEHVVVKQVTIPPYPYLRPAADETYPSLARRIRRNFERGAPQGGGA